MFNKLRVLLMIGVFGIFAMPVFAQGSGGYCDLPITGTTQVGYNTNAGKTYFDAHTGGGGGLELADLSIALGAGQAGYAPGDLGHAACAEVATGDTYKLKGWAWNSNLGFISFGCSGGVNNAGGGDVTCGSIDYGVTIEAPSGSPSVRKLTGYAWSPTFGWIEFADQNTGDAYPYGVTVNASGAMSGYAWTQAKVYMNFAGANVIFNPDDYEPPQDEWCDNKPWLCVTVTPNPTVLEFDTPEAVGFEIGVPLADEMKIADGVDGYSINISLMGADGVTPLNLATYDNGTAFLDGIEFAWEDTVKKDQTVMPGVTGAVLSKPLPLNNTTDHFSDYFEDPDGNGVYKTKAKIRSYAPTTGGNLSFTTNTTTPFAVPNENIAIMAGPTGLTKSELILKRIDVTVPLRKDGVNVFEPFPVYPNGEENMYLNFRPAMELGTLFINSFKDEISGVRQIPENLRLGMVEHGVASSFVSDDLRVKLGYSPTKTQAPEEGVNCSSATFDVQFMKTLAGAANTAINKSVLDRPISLMTSLVDVPIVAVIPGATEGATNLCAAAKAPYLASTISYGVGGQTIKYFSNHLPRISAGNIGNPAVIVHGNIFSQKTANVRGDRVLETQGNIFQKSIRNVVYKRIQPYFTGNGPAFSGDCVVEVLGDAGTKSVTGCSASYYQYHEVGDEHILYFKNAKVTMNLTNGTWTGKWVIVADGGNIFIRNNIYNGPSNPDNLVLISLLKQRDTTYGTGNVYIYPCSEAVRNIQAAIFADGALFSFNGNTSDLDSDGVPVWSDSAEMLDALGCQLKIEGAISTGLNTIGGADLDSEGKTYLLKGGGRNVATDDFEKRMEAQLYDLNYLRLFKLQVQTVSDLPYDQKCGRALTAELIRDIANGMTVCGTKSTPESRCFPGGEFDQDFACDGINPFKPYSEDESAYGLDIGPDGDAVPPVDPPGGETLYSDGLDNDAIGDTQFDPVYVFYDQSVNDSFVFQDEGSASITY